MTTIERIRQAMTTAKGDFATTTMEAVKRDDAAVAASKGKINPCPFCGSLDVIFHDCSSYYARTDGNMVASFLSECKSCSARGPGFGHAYTAAECIAAWNKRKP